MKRLTRFAPILATALLLAFFCGCGKFKLHKQAAKPPPRPPGTNAPVDPRDVDTPGFKLPGAIRGGPVKIGTLLLPDGTIYQGQLSAAGVPHGKGRILSQNGTDQRGEWRYGRIFRVSGTWVAPNGTKEVGTWNVDGTKSSGTILWTTGWKYVGEWWVTDGNAELPHGVGVMTSPDGNVEDGMWTQGNFVGPAPKP